MYWIFLFFVSFANAFNNKLLIHENKCDTILNDRLLLNWCVNIKSINKNMIRNFDPERKNKNINRIKKQNAYLYESAVWDAGEIPWEFEESSTTIIETKQYYPQEYYVIPSKATKRYLLLEIDESVVEYFRIRFTKSLQDEFVSSDMFFKEILDIDNVNSDISLIITAVFSLIGLTSTNNFKTQFYQSGSHNNNNNNNNRRTKRRALFDIAFLIFLILGKNVKCAT